MKWWNAYELIQFPFSLGFLAIFVFNIECKLLLISMALWRWSLCKLSGEDRMKGKETPKLGEIKVPVSEAFKSFAHRVGFVLLIRWVMAKPFQVMCKTSDLSWVLWQCGYHQRGLSWERLSFLSLTSHAVLQFVSHLGGWCGELIADSVGLGARGFPELQQVGWRGGIDTTTVQQLWCVCHGFSPVDAEYYTPMSVTAINLLEAYLLWMRPWYAEFCLPFLCSIQKWIYTCVGINISMSISLC